MEPACRPTWRTTSTRLRAIRASRYVQVSGFGRDDVAAVGKHAAGAIVGSALVEVLEEKGDPKAFLSGLIA